MKHALRRHGHPHAAISQMLSISLLLWIVLPFAPAASAQPATGQYIADRRTGCRVWSDPYDPKDSIAWSGSCQSGYAHGPGTLRWYSGGALTATYKGQMKAGMPEGMGTYAIDGYGLLQGHFTGGLLSGKGTIRLAGGGILAGNFVKGTFLNLDDAYLPLLQKADVGLHDTSGIYNGGGDGRLFYYALPPKGRPRAALVLFPSTGESAENVISCNKALMQQAYQSGILCLVIAANYNKGLESDASALHFFDTCLADAVTRYGAPKDKFILCGLSLGGENALQYTEMSRNDRYTTYLKPLAVIGVDPPVDMADLYHNAKDQIAAYTKDTTHLTPGKRLALNEDYYLIDYFHKLYGGPPEAFPEKYVEGSLFSRSRADGGNARYLATVPVRLYCDPDIIWQLKNRNRDYYSMNAANLSAMINCLMQVGNSQAELIAAVGKGYRVDGTRHPHSWSIVDAGDCIRWMLKLVR